MNKLEIVIATNNENKVKEYREIFADFPVKVTSLKDENIVSDPEETGTTFSENSLIKAKAVANKTNKIVIADDSGLCISALDNFPGIYSSRFMEGRPYEEKHQALLEMLKNKEDKSAAFYCAIALINFVEEDKLFLGKCEGEIKEPVYTNNGFGYDPIFFFKKANKRFSEMTHDEKNSISHRGMATKMLLDFVKEHLDEYFEEKSK